MVNKTVKISALPNTGSRRTKLGSQSPTAIRKNERAWSSRRQHIHATTTALRPVFDGFARPNGFGFLLKLISLAAVPSSSSVATPFGLGSWPEGPEVGPIPTPREGEHSARTASTPAAWNTRLCAMGCSGDLTTHLSLGANPTSQFPCLCTLRTVRALEPGNLYNPFPGGSRGDNV